jgi:hypothetical protein
MDPIQIEQIIQETEKMTDRDLLVQIYVRMRMVDAFVEQARSNPMLSAMMGQ